MAEHTIRFRPSEPQLKFLAAHNRHVAYGGARGGGKSFIVRKKAILLALRWPKIKILIVRRTFRELDNNHIQPLLEELHGIARYNRQDKRFAFPNGSTISFGYCNNDGDLGQYQGAEYDIIFLDEATQLRQEWIEKINACCRGTGNYPRRTYYTCNPGGESHHYIKRLFVDRRFVGAEEPDDYTFIQAKVTDNHALMEAQPEYVKGLETLPPRLRKMWLEGSWDIAEGSVFEEFIQEPKPWANGMPPKWTHVIDAKSFKLPKSWTVYMSFDWGFRRPFSASFFAVDFDGCEYLITEFYGCQRDMQSKESIPNEGLKWPPKKVFTELRRYMDEHPYLAGKDIQCIADPAIWDAETGESIAETAAKCGIHFAPGDHKRLAGLMQCHYRLQQDSDGYSRFYVLDSCKDFIRTIPTLMYSETKVEDVDTDLEDHIYDTWRYFCMSRPIAPMQEEQKPYAAWGADPLDLFH